jgi:hypothetical protein
MEVNLVANSTSAMTGAQGQLFYSVNEPTPPGPSVRTLTRIETATGSKAQVVAGWSSRALMSAAGDKLYTIDLNSHRMWRVSSATLLDESAGPEGDWPNPRMMAATGEGIFVIEGMRLWRSNPDSLADDVAGPEGDWGNARMIAALDGKIFVIDATRLWRVDPNTLINDGSGPEGDWPNPRMMAAVNGRLFVMEGPRLWRVDPATLVNDGAGPENDWPGAKAIATDGSGLFVVDESGVLWKVDQVNLNRLARVGL